MSGEREADIVGLHGWKMEDGNQTYCEPDDAELAGWCVYTRINDPVTPEPGGLDVSDEQDFPTRDAAMVEAARRGAALNLEVREY